VCSGEPVEFAAIPPFQPELFGRLINRNLEKYKQFNKGIEQLMEEGVVQVFYPVDTLRREPILGAVGQLQFEVVAARLEQEYGVNVRIDPLPHTVATWVDGREETLSQVRWGSQALRLYDRYHQLVILFESAWQVRYLLDQVPNLQLKTIAGIRYTDFENKKYT
jgi:peptide chain release factor 3